MKPASRIWSVASSTGRPWTSGTSASPGPVETLIVTSEPDLGVLARRRVLAGDAVLLDRVGLERHDVHLEALALEDLRRVLRALVDDVGHGLGLRAQQQVGADGDRGQARG